MKRVKLAFIGLAISAAVGSAFATRPCVVCDNAQQYIWNGSAYIAVGDYGEDFDCYVGAGVCTFYKPDPMGQPNVYAPCHEGAYTPL